MAKKGNIVSRTKGNLVLIVLALLAMIWLCAISILTDNSEEEAQLALINSAKTYLEDDLYIKAVNNYKTAIADYNTEHNATLETELLAIYLEAGMMADYYSSINERIEKDTAAESEYVALVKYYVEGGNATAALNILQVAMKKFENEELIQLQEQVLYAYKAKTLEYETLRQPSDSWVVPTFDGNKWGYLASGGSIMLDYKYEEATNFSGSYAVVKLDGVYTLIDKNGYRNAIDKDSLEAVTDLSSSAIVGVKGGKYQLYSRSFKKLSDEQFDMLYANDNGTYMAQKNGKWAILSDKLEPITEYKFSDVVLNSQGEVFKGSYAMVKDEAGYFLVNKLGEAMYSTRYADAKGYEGSYCAVADANGNWGYTNSKGELIIAHQYEDAESFSDRLAAVQIDGKWGYINKYNELKIDAIYENAYPFIKGKALVKTEEGIHELITLKYYDYFE